MPIVLPMDSCLVEGGVRIDRSNIDRCNIDRCNIDRCSMDCTELPRRPPPAYSPAASVVEVQDGF